MNTIEARHYANEYLRTASTVSQYRDGEYGPDWIYVQGWSAQVHASWAGAAHLAETFGTEWRRTASGAAVRLP